MNVSTIRVKSFFDSQNSIYVCLALALSTALIGYAPSSISLSLFVLFSIRYFFLKRPSVKIATGLLFPVLIFFLFSFSVFWTVDLPQTKIGLGRMISLLIVPIIFIFLPKTPKNAYILFFSVINYSNVLYGIIFLVSALTNFIQTKALTVFTYHDLVSVLELNAIYVSLYFLTSFLYVLFIKEKSKAKWILIVFYAFMILLLSSKTLIFSMLVATLFWLVKQSLSTKHTVLIFVLLVLGLSLASIKLYDRIKFEAGTKLSDVFEKKEFGPVYIWTGTSLRLFYLRLLSEQINEDKIFWKGFGLFASKKNIIERHKKYKTYFGFHNFNYHNQYAQIFAECGIIGLILISLMLIFLIVKALSFKNYFWLFMSVSFCLIFLSESLLWRQRGLFLFIIFYCIIAKSNKNISQL